MGPTRHESSQLSMYDETSGAPPRPLKPSLHGSCCAHRGDATRHRVGSYALAVEVNGCAEGTALADGLARLRAFRAAASL